MHLLKKRFYSVMYHLPQGGLPEGNCIICQQRFYHLPEGIVFFCQSSLSAERTIPSGKNTQSLLAKDDISSPKLCRVASG